MPTTSVGVFRDFLPSQQIGKSFIQSVFGFSVAQEFCPWPPPTP